MFYSMLDRTDPMPDYEELIKFLGKKEYKIALATSSMKKYVDKKLQILGIRDIFDAIVTGDEVKHGKHDPDIFLIAAKKLAIPPANCVVIEDADNGIAAAKAAGMKVIGVRNSRVDSGQDLNQADIVVENLSEVPKAIKSL